MLLMGDELGHSQAGNNNAYCQDNALTWIDWSTFDEQLLRFMQKLTGLRRRHPVLRRRHFLHGAQLNAAGLSDVIWLAEDGVMTTEQWQNPSRRFLGLLLTGTAGPDLDAEGRLLEDSTLLLLLNAAERPAPFRLPELAGVTGWRMLLDTTRSETDAPAPAATTVIMTGRSLMLLAAEDKAGPPA
jgi:glycogen operon protein